ncbi:unnamed protein product [marine sediment metagenome]|uniref:Serine aminopeptidase S33 domain-containing protein n=1 Tax=marine sediment metagenome TaxID=412755 RepID=X0WCI8_9ZZZZ
MLENLLKGIFIEKGEPFYNKASKELGVLMFHGLTATPYQVRELGDFLYSQGISNFGACIAGHGTKKENLLKTTRKDWLDSAMNAYLEFQKVYPKTIVLGFSMGGLLALNLSNEYKPQGTIVIATPYNLNIKGNLLAMIGFHKSHPDDNVKYPGPIPIKIKHQIVKFVKETKGIMDKIDDPILIIQGTKDRRVSKRSPYLIYNKVKSQHKELLILPGEEHIILKGNYKYQIFNKIHEFVLNCI